MSFILIIIPLIVLVLTQILKLSIDKIRGNLNLKSIFMSYGGMPSSHTSFAVSIVTLVGITEGFSSALFAVSTVFTLIIMRDAVTFRHILGQQGRLLNQLVKKLPGVEQKKMPHFQERLGHSLLEVGVGAVWGVCVTLGLYWIF